MDLSEARQCLGKEKVSFTEQEIKCLQSSRIHSTCQESNLWRNKCICSSLPVQTGTWSFFVQRCFAGLLMLVFRQMELITFQQSKTMSSWRQCCLGLPNPNTGKPTVGWSIRGTAVFPHNWDKSKGSIRGKKAQNLSKYHKHFPA